MIFVHQENKKLVSYLLLVLSLVGSLTLLFVAGGALLQRREKLESHVTQVLKRSKPQGKVTNTKKNKESLFFSREFFLSVFRREHKRKGNPSARLANYCKQF